MRLAAACSILLAFATSALAVDAEYKKCVDKSDGTNVAYSDCGYAMLKRDDDRLNAAWKDALAAMPSDESKKSLLEEQRAWNAYKEKSCLIYTGDDFGREGQVLNYPTCRAEVIESRTRYLRTLKDG